MTIHRLFPQSKTAPVVALPPAAQREYLCRLLEDADIVQSADGRHWLVLPAHELLIDHLAAIGAEDEDREEDDAAEDADPAEESGEPGEATDWWRSSLAARGGV